MEENRCIICGIGIPEGRMICPQCEAEYPSEEFIKVIERLEQFESAENAIAKLKAVLNEFLSLWEETFGVLWKQLQQWIYTIKEKIPKTPYFFKRKVRIFDKRPHKQHRIRNNCRKERNSNGNKTNR